MKILLIAYSFPPLQDAHSLRWYYLSNALAKIGLDIDVITIEHPESQSGNCSLMMDERINVIRVFPGFIESVALKSKKSIGVDGLKNSKLRTSFKFRVLKSVYWMIRNTIGNILPGDIRTEWYPFAVRTIQEKIESNNYDCIITSHEPWVDSLLGLYIKNVYGEKLKWVADFGDPYVSIYTPKHKLWIENRLEKNVYSKADALIFTNDNVIKHLKKKYDFLDSKKILLLEQGFSYQKYREANQEYKAKNSIFTLVYTGTFYKEFRNPTNLIKALSLLDFDYKFIVAGRNEVFLNDFKVLGEKIVFEGFVDHSKALDLQRRSDVLVHLANKTPIQVPGKIYEYLGSNRPILAINFGYEDETSLLIEKLRCGVVTTDNVLTIKESIEKLYYNWISDKNDPRISSEELFCYSWEKKAEDLNSFLRNL